MIANAVVREIQTVSFSLSGQMEDVTFRPMRVQQWLTPERSLGLHLVLPPQHINARQVREHTAIFADATQVNRGK